MKKPSQAERTLQVLKEQNLLAKVVFVPPEPSSEEAVEEGPGVVEDRNAIVALARALRSRTGGYSLTCGMAVTQGGECEDAVKAAIAIVEKELTETSEGKVGDAQKPPPRVALWHTPVAADRGQELAEVCTWILGAHSHLLDQPLSSSKLFDCKDSHVMVLSHSYRNSSPRFSLCTVPLLRGWKN